MTGELAQLIAAHRAATAHAQLVEGRPLKALAATGGALRWYPYQTRAQYTRLVALERLGRWAALAQSARRAERWHPDSGAVLKLLGEAAWMRGQNAEAARALWAMLWRSPIPWDGPGQVWRLAMLASRAAWGDQDPRARAAATRVLTLIEKDTTMSEVDRAAARREARQTLTAH